MTAHRAKGLEWRLVVVAGVQEGLWPDLRRRGSLLEADRIGRDGLAEPLPPGALLAEERRLFYVAATRARERLVVTAVQARRRRRRPAVPLPDANWASSRRTSPPAAPPAGGRRARRRTARHHRRPGRLARRCATPPPQRLARLAALRRRRGGHPLVPAAHPDRWWGLHEPTRTAVPLRDRGPARRAVRQRPGPARQHLLAAVVPGPRGEGRRPRHRRPGLRQRRARPRRRGRLRPHPRRPDVLMDRLDSVWDALAFDAPWKSRQEKENARAALERFLRWHVMDARRPRHRSPPSTASTSPWRRASTRCASAAAWTGSSADAAGTRLRRRLQDRQGQADRRRGRPPPPTRRLPARGARGRRRRGLRRTPPVRAAPNSSTCGWPRRRGGRRHAARGPGAGPLARDADPGPPDAGASDAGPPADRAANGAGADGGDDWVGGLLATAAGRVLDERFTPTTGPTAALRLPRRLHRAARGAPRRGVSRPAPPVAGPVATRG